MPLQAGSHSLSPLFCKAQSRKGIQCLQGGIQGALLLVNLGCSFKSFPLEYKNQSLVYISLCISCPLLSIYCVYSCLVYISIHVTLLYMIT